MISYGIPLPIEETKAAADHWLVTGYASTFGNTDLGNDAVMPGAFDRWLKGGSKTRFLYTHRPDKVLGVFTEMKADKRGLLVTGRISKTPLGEEVYTLVRDGAVDSFSIGYVTQDSEMKGGVRQLKDLDLPETSLVAIPMNPEAMVTAWKDWLSIFNLEGDEPPPTLAEKAAQLRDAFTQFTGETRQLVEAIDKPLSSVKRRELTDLLDCVQGWDAVRTELKAVLDAAPSTRVVDARRAVYELAERRKRLAHILEN